MKDVTIPKAIILTDGMLHEAEAKTAHGLIRGTDRYEIVALIDSIHAGKDAGVVLDGIHRNIPVFADIGGAIAAINGISYCVIGIATVGGILPKHFIPIIESCIRKNISVVNGLHDFLSNIPVLVELAKQHHVELIDIRKPKQRKDLHFWNASIFSVEVPVIAVIGTDCATGKRTTCRMTKQACTDVGINAQMIYTGQTGWLQGGKYGFIFDSTLNDFISGELEHAIVSCWKETKADVILIEGQSALRNPSGPCGSELLVSGNARHVILVHAPKRKYYDHLKEWGAIHSLASEIELIKLYGSKVITVALNTEHCTEQEAFDFQRKYEAELQLPVLLPLRGGVEKIIPVIQTLINYSS
ncbi:MAG TPA: DUF1611 domain-containing protein [Puia sp.]|jgi:uncharacterized NAD-dependent epimerase/dehydratase family protein|nr:DUF1611 domain-containing protein [Puia sp.]